MSLNFMLLIRMAGLGYLEKCILRANFTLLVCLKFRHLNIPSELVGGYTYLSMTQVLHKYYLTYLYHLCSDFI